MRRSERQPTRIRANKRCEPRSHLLRSKRRGATELERARLKWWLSRGRQPRRPSILPRPLRNPFSCKSRTEIRAFGRASSHSRSRLQIPCRFDSDRIAAAAYPLSVFCCPHSLRPQPSVSARRRDRRARGNPDDCLLFRRVAIGTDTRRQLLCLSSERPTRHPDEASIGGLSFGLRCLWRFGHAEEACKAQRRAADHRPMHELVRPWPCHVPAPELVDNRPTPFPVCLPLVRCTRT